MKYKKLFSITLCSLFVTSIASFASMQNRATPELILVVDSPKAVYKLGEPITFSFELNNKTSEAIALLDIFGTENGYLHINVSKDGKNFVGSDDPGWGILDMEGKTYIKPDENKIVSADILWNLSSRETAEFKFKETGVYFFKAYYTATVEGRNSPIKLESESIQITIEKPAGEDLEVWNKIKDNGDFAYFIQKGDFFIPSYKLEERETFQKEIEDIINQYPNSFYAQSLRQSLAKFEVNEERRKESMRKIQQP